jgi:ABC-type amino acid transport substrate-binding protein
MPQNHSTETPTLLVGVDQSPPPPLNFGLPGSDEFRGFEVDLTNTIAERLGLVVKYRSELWKVMLAELADGTMDMVCTAATITPNRREVVDFSDPYLDTQLALVARIDWPIHALEPLRCETVGVRIATTAEEFVRAHVPLERVRQFDLNTGAYAALRAEQVSIVIDDLPIASHFAAHIAGLGHPIPLPGTEAQYGYVFAKGNDVLRKRVNDAIRAVKADGQWRALCHKWIPSDREVAHAGDRV